MAALKLFINREMAKYVRIDFGINNTVNKAGIGTQF
jgi:hypothetical protein